MKTIKAILLISCCAPLLAGESDDEQEIPILKRVKVTAQKYGASRQFGRSESEAVEDARENFDEARGLLLTYVEDAITTENLSRIKKLIAHFGVDHKYSGDTSVLQFNDTLLHAVARQLSLPLVQELVEKYSAHLGLRNVDNHTPKKCAQEAVARTIHDQESKKAILALLTQHKRKFRE